MAAPHNKGKGRAIKWLRQNATYEGDDCLIWPFATCNGYGHFGHNGEHHYAHRFMCELAHGPTPSPDHEASHSCGRGHEACTSPKHLSWKTRTENQADRALHGRKSTGTRGKLTPQQAEKIRALRGLKTQAEIAVMFGVSRANISLIMTGNLHVRKKRPGLGYSYIRARNKWGARIMINNRQIWLGTFDTEQAARKAFLAADREARVRLTS